MGGSWSRHGLIALTKTDKISPLMEFTFSVERQIVLK